MKAYVFRFRHELAPLVLLGLVAISCGASGSATQAKNRVSTRALAEVASDTVDLEGFVTKYSEAPFLNSLDTNSPRSVDDIVLQSCDGYVRGSVTGIERLTRRVSLARGTEAEPPNFWLDEVAIGLHIKAESSSLRSGSALAPGSDVTVALVVWQGKPHSTKDEAEANFVKPLLASPPVGAELQVFVQKVEESNLVRPCMGAYGVVGAQPDGTGLTSFGSFATNGSVYGFSNISEIERQTESFLEPA